MRQIQRNRVSRRKQRGIATIFVILLAGMALTAAAFGAFHALRSAQQRQLSVHATTPAQATAWRGAEIIRSYLGQLDLATVKRWVTLGPPVGLAINGVPGITAQVTAVEQINPPAEQYRVTVEVRGLAAGGTALQTASTLQVVYHVTPGPPGPAGNPNVLNIHHDLDMDGNIRVIGGQNAVINVDGSATLDDASITGVDTLNATGSITVGANIDVNTVHSNQNITLIEGAQIQQVSARGNVDASASGVSVGSIRANGTVNFGGDSAGVIEATGDVTVTRGSVRVTTLLTEGNVSWTGTSGGASSIRANGDVLYKGGNRPTTIEAIGDVTLEGPKIATVRTKGNTRRLDWGGIGSLRGEGNLYIGNAWDQVNAIIGGSFTKLVGMTYNVTVTPGYQVDITPVVVPAVPVVSVPPPTIDVYPLKAAANYAFEIDADGDIQVTVQNVSGIPDGLYALGYKLVGGAAHPDYLCRKGDLMAPAVNGQRKCTLPVKRVCQVNTQTDNCLTYATGTKKWTLNGKSFARGVVWFEGDLETGNGIYANTFLATGNINTTGSHRTISPNYAGYGVLCENATLPGQSSPNPDFAGMYPTNLCNTDEEKIVTNTIGNVAYMAGGWSEGVYVGGNITIAASTRVDGSLLAGNLVDTGGNNQINGFITAAAHRAGTGETNQFDGSTTIDLSALPSTYNPGSTPSGPAGSTVVLWVRYL